MPQSRLMIRLLKRIVISSDKFIGKKMSELYTVQKILAKRQNKNGTIEYQVKWKDYPVEESTWQPFKNLKYVEEMVIRFQKQNPHLSKHSKTQNQLTVSKASLIYEEDHSSQDTQQQQKKPDPIVQSDEVKGSQGEKAKGITFFVEDNEVESQNEENHKINQPQQHSIQELYPPKKKKNGKGGSQQTEKRSKQINQSKTINHNQPQSNTEMKASKITSNGIKATNISNQYEPSRRVRKERIDSEVPDLQQIEENMRYRVRTMNRRGGQQTPSQVKIKQMSVDESQNYFYLVQVDDLNCCMSRDTLIQHFPDELIRFYQSKIQFNRIPKLPK